MAQTDRDTTSPIQQRRMALSRWEDEGGAERCGPQLGTPAHGDVSEPPPLSNADLVQLRVRVIALENLMLALFADATDGQIERARVMAAYIAPRPGFTPHPLTIGAANQMLGLIERARRFEAWSSSEMAHIPAED